jgi:hypothetical protein
MLVDFEDIFPAHMTKAKRNELMRDYAYEKMTAIIKTYDIPGEVLEVRKLQNDKN